MAIQIQYDLFSEEDFRFQEYRQRIEQIEKSTDKVRRKLFANDNAREKLVLDLLNRVEIMERGLCLSGRELR